MVKQKHFVVNVFKNKERRFTREAANINFLKLMDKNREFQQLCQAALQTFEEKIGIQEG